MHSIIMSILDDLIKYIDMKCQKNFFSIILTYFQHHDTTAPSHQPPPPPPPPPQKSFFYFSYYFAPIFKRLERFNKYD